MSEEREGLISGKEKRPNIFQRLAYTISKKIDEWKYNRIKAKSERERNYQINQSMKFYKQVKEHVAKELNVKGGRADQMFEKLNSEQDPFAHPEIESKHTEAYNEAYNQAIRTKALELSQDALGKRLAKSKQNADKRIHEKFPNMERTR